MANGRNKKGSASNELLQFLIGLILLGTGLFIFSKHVVVHSGWYMWSPMGYGVSSGMTVFPLIIGLTWMFFNKKSIVAKIVTLLGAIFIVVTIIMSVSMTFVSTSLYDYILILGMIAAGSGMLLRVLFKPHKTEED